MRVRPRALIAVVLVAVVLTAGFVAARSYGAEVWDRTGEHGPSAGVIDLHGVDQLKAAFNADAGTPRLVVLFSPT